MEHQSWSIQNHLKFKDFLLANFFVKLKPMIIAQVILGGLFFYYFKVYLLDFKIILIIIFAYCLLLSFMIPLICFVVFRILYKKQNKLGPVTIKISETDFTSKAEGGGFETIVQWPAITKIYHRFDMIYVECKLVDKRIILLPYHIFKNSDERKHFYEDLIYFWEQGR